jgi:hypothetical protein
MPHETSESYLLQGFFDKIGELGNTVDEFFGEIGYIFQIYSKFFDFWYLL